MKNGSEGTSTWRPPTRRAFVAMIGAAAAALAATQRAYLADAREPADEVRPHSTVAGLPRWIGHC